LKEVEGYSAESCECWYVREGENGYEHLPWEAMAWREELGEGGQKKEGVSSTESFSREGERVHSLPSWRVKR